LSYGQIADIPDPNFKYVLANTLCLDANFGKLIVKNIIKE
jgi:hypothetical protein